MAEYSDSALEFWSTQDDKIHLGFCPCCGLNSLTILCEHCDFDIGKYNDKVDLVFAEKFVFSLHLDQKGAKMFRELSIQEDGEFRQWARNNLDPNKDEINPVWHPVVQDECADMISELDESPNVDK